MKDSPLINKIIPSNSHNNDQCANVNDFIMGSKQWNIDLLSMYLPKKIIDKITTIPIQISHIEE